LLWQWVMGGQYHGIINDGPYPQPLSPSYHPTTVAAYCCQALHLPLRLSLSYGPQKGQTLACKPPFSATIVVATPCNKRLFVAIHGANHPIPPLKHHCLPVIDIKPLVMATKSTLAAPVATKSSLVLGNPNIPCFAFHLQTDSGVVILSLLPPPLAVAADPLFTLL